MNGVCFCGSMKRALFLAMALMISIPSAKADERWDFIKVKSNYAAAPKWEAESGKAQIQITGDKIEILVYYDSDADSSAPDKPPYPRIKISGTLGADRIIKATFTLLDTDANPAKITGRYITRSEPQIWGEKRKIVTHKEIVFPHPPNFEFLGFLGQEVRDE
jgi:hypothetical protein